RNEKERFRVWLEVGPGWCRACQARPGLVWLTAKLGLNYFGLPWPVASKWKEM
ncbi:hypothetical protein L195_g045795, partial [Trifolium pratense]